MRPSHTSRTLSSGECTVYRLEPRPVLPPAARELAGASTCEGDDEEDGAHTQLCTCGPAASFASSATFCTSVHDDEHPPPPDSPQSQKRADTSRGHVLATALSRTVPVATSSRRPSARRISQPPSSRRASAGPSFTSSLRATMPYDGWISRVEGDVEAAHPPRAHPSRSASALESLYPSVSLYPSMPGSALGSPYAPSARAPRRTRNPTRHVSPAQHTLALMAERARLLGEVASIRAGAGRTR